MIFKLLLFNINIFYILEFDPTLNLFYNNMGSCSMESTK